MYREYENLKIILRPQNPKIGTLRTKSSMKILMSYLKMKYLNLI